MTDIRLCNPACVSDLILPGVRAWQRKYGCDDWDVVTDYISDSVSVKSKFGKVEVWNPSNMNWKQEFSGKMKQLAQCEQAAWRFRGENELWLLAKGDSV